jgi:hypothetical protein
MFDFAIRDDDTNYHTDPEELTAAYEDYDVPVSLSVVPFHGCTRSNAIPERYWDGGDERFPLAENEALVAHLSDGISDGRYSIMQHGYDHVKTDDGPEFGRDDDLRAKVREGRSYLEDVLDVEIDVFVPPNNTFCAAGLDAVKAANMRTCYYPTPLDRPKSPEVLSLFASDLRFKYRHTDAGPVGFLRDAYRFWGQQDRSVFMPVRPFPYQVQGGWECTAVTLGDGTRVEKVKRQLALADELDGQFCLAVHYHNFRSDTFRRKFEAVLSYARDELEPNFVHCADLFPDR